MKREITLRVNGQDRTVVAHSHHTLLKVLRDELQLFGCREGCGIGMCGACTVLLDSEPVSACLMLAPVAQGHEITTIEGIGTEEQLDPVQQAFFDKTGFQCSYCTPGMILAAQGLLADRPRPTRDEIRHYMAGNLCRCGSYNNIVEAIEEAASRLAPRS